MRNRLFAVICVLLALAMLPGGASAKAKKAPKKDIGIQLYSVRSLIGVFGKSQGDYKPVLKQLADMGYTSVEAASYKDGMLYGQTPEQFRKDVEDAGMRVISTHCTLNLSDEELASGDFSKALACGTSASRRTRPPVRNISWSPRCVRFRRSRICRPTAAISTRWVRAVRPPA